MMCLRHPRAAGHRGHCAACLLEAAFAHAPTAASQPEGSFTIQMPLGHSPASSVFLVKRDGVAGRLLRLKTWNKAPPRAFLARFERLQRQLTDWGNDAIPAPLAAWVDSSGHPSVLTEFNQGVPVFERLESGALDPMEAESCLMELRAVTRTAHGRGLVHGSIVGGNIIVGGRCRAARLLDFGHAALVAPDGDAAPEAAADIRDFDRLIHTVRALSSVRPSRL